MSGLLSWQIEVRNRPKLFPSPMAAFPTMQPTANSSQGKLRQSVNGQLNLTEAGQGATIWQQTN